ncbi:uncharacterized protein B0T23DRAFT_396229 [Neurospora hispaniola]|uniref:Uncharacterized protein n=1 Tax=Neurospora hispaniola TaxID=588809 RepID=A0AAJ0I945_9PEZI|nr:hypothetical protein B0T23DRAFT_396229 [Neurospora hispaniola]
MTNFADSTIPSSGALLDELSTHYSFGHSSISLAMENGSIPRCSATPFRPCSHRRHEEITQITDDLFKDVFVELPEHEVEDLAMPRATGLPLTVVANLHRTEPSPQRRNILLNRTQLIGGGRRRGRGAGERENREIRTRVFDEVSRSDEKATLGVSTVKKLIQLNYDGGLSYMFMYLIVDAHLIQPKDCVNMVFGSREVTFVCMDSQEVCRNRTQADQPPRLKHP